MATYSSILAWRIPMDRGIWQATVLGLQELDTTECLSTTQHFSTLLLIHTIKIWELRILLSQVIGIENFGHE